MFRWAPLRSLCLLSLLLFAKVSFSAELVSNEALGLRVQRGFRVTVFSEGDLANDIYAMTLDSQGRVVVTSAGYIKTLFDSDGDRRANQSTVFALTSGGGTGLCFDGNSLYFSGDGWLSRYEDANVDGVADGLPQRLFPLGTGEHGGHAMRKGPDGWWYLIGGNDAGFDRRHVTLPESPITLIEAGALLRLTPDGAGSEVIAHGFRNPYDFDFNSAGDIFTYDSDVESDLFLPWYAPTRLYHVAYAGHHGWRLNGWKRSWPRPDYYEDTVEILDAIGRGSPTGVACYRHVQFPPYYRDGVFALDWTFGRVYFIPIQRDDASYTGEPQVFIEPIGTHGFAPTDMAVAPDGSLYISIGGRKTRGAVYRVEYVGPGFVNPPIVPTANVEITSVLMAPQPLDAWSRANWMPRVTELGAEPFRQVVTDELIAPSLRVRAIEILTEMFGGVPPIRVRAAAQSLSPLVRARVAWSLGRVPVDNAAPALLLLANDADAGVARAALDAMLMQLELFQPAELQRVILANLNDPDKRVRQSAARLASRLPETIWGSLATALSAARADVRLMGILAQIWRSPDVTNHPELLGPLAGLLGQTRDPVLRLAAVRLIILALGDWRLKDPSLEVYTAYEPAVPVALPERGVEEVRRAVRPVLPSGNEDLDWEASRVLAMLEDNFATLPRTLAAFITERSAATSDFHYLVCLSRLKVSSPDLTPKIAQTILGLDRKLSGQENRTKQNWNARLAEVLQALLTRYPALGEALLRHPDLATPNHVGLALGLGPAKHASAARLYRAAVLRNPNFPWSGQLLELFSALPANEIRPLLRGQWANVALRDEIIMRLAQKPETTDREKFLAGLSSSQLDVARVSVASLRDLPRDPGTNQLVAIFGSLRRLLNEPKEQALRAQILGLINQQTGQTFQIAESAMDATSLARAYQPVFAWFGTKYPLHARALNAADGEDPAQWVATLRSAPWTAGNAQRGSRIFQERGCQTCHTGGTALGPDLSAAVSRSSIEDLFMAIVFPNRDVAAPYRMTRFRMKDEQVFQGLVVFESADGIIIQTSAATTARLNDADIISRELSNLSLMPSGLLHGLKPAELADLHAYLKTLQPRSR